MDSGSIGPLPAYCSMNRKKGEMKSAKTPSMSKPTFMETQFKQIGDEGQQRLLAARRECATEKIQRKVSNRPERSANGRTSSGASGSRKDRRTGAPRGGYRQHHGRREGDR